MFMQAVYIPPSMSDFLKDKPWRWLEVGGVDRRRWDKLRNYIPPPGATTTGKTTGTPAPSAPQPGMSPFHSQTKKRNSFSTSLLMMDEFYVFHKCNLVVCFRLTPG